MTIIKGDVVVAGSVNKINTEPMEEYLNSTIKAFSELEWAGMTDEEKAAYKLALVYQE